MPIEGGRDLKKEHANVFLLAEGSDSLIYGIGCLMYGIIFLLVFRLCKNISACIHTVLLQLYLRPGLLNNVSLAWREILELFTVPPNS